MQNSTVEAIYNALKCIFCDIKFQNFLGGDTPEPPYGRGSRATPSRTHPRTTSGASRLRSSGGRCAADCLDPTSPHQQFLDPPLLTSETLCQPQDPPPSPTPSPHPPAPTSKSFSPDLHDLYKCSREV